MSYIVRQATDGRKERIRVFGHNIDGSGFRLATLNGRIMKGQTVPADIVKLADDFGIAAENFKLALPDPVTRVLPSFSLQSFLLPVDRFDIGTGGPAPWFCSVI